jgi:N-formylglutamate amidohydrolase
MSCPGDYIVNDGIKLPILLTCPHGGVNSLPSGGPRQNNVNVHCSGVGGETFEVRPDLCTKKLTRSIANNILNLYGKHPYIQIAEISRKYVDFNRDIACAYDHLNEQAKTAYESYHKKILLKIQEMLSQNENGLAFLFDIHGTGRKTVQDSNGKNQYVEVIIGTEKGSTIFPLNQKDPVAWWGKTTGLIPLLLDKGVAVWPPNQTEEMANNAPLDGGYTIETYSSKFSERLVTIQVEVIRCLREPIYTREKFAADLAECIYSFVKPFI